MTALICSAGFVTIQKRQDMSSGRGFYEWGANDSQQAESDEVSGLLTVGEGTMQTILARLFLFCEPKMHKTAAFRFIQNRF